jgi:hypothetical protein
MVTAHRRGRQKINPHPHLVTVIKHLINHTAADTPRAAR